VCHGFIQEHGGDIQVKSRKGSGTTFSITLPVLNENSAEKVEANLP